jgi:hypothetical protein
MFGRLGRLLSGSINFLVDCLIRPRQVGAFAPDYGAPFPLLGKWDSVPGPYGAPVIYICEFGPVLLHGHPGCPKVSAKMTDEQLEIWLNHEFSRMYVADRWQSNVWVHPSTVTRLRHVQYPSPWVEKNDL